MRRVFVTAAALFAAAFLGALPGAAGIYPRLDLRGDAVPGGVMELTLVVPGVRLRNVSVEVQDEARRPVHSFAGFRLPESSEASGGETWVVLVGVPQDQRPGEYLFRISAKGAGEELSLVRPVTIEDRGFAEEDVPLNKTMSDLRKERDPRKEEEAKALYELLMHFNPDSVFQRGPFVHPVGSFPESAGFGDRRTYVYADGGRAKSPHGGVDYATPRGTPVSACGAGRVVFARNLVITGFTVAIEHLPGVYSLYFHLDSVDAKVGRTVKPGERIGASGMTGLATGPHFHWELRVAGVAVDPRPFLARGLLSGERP